MGIVVGAPVGFELVTSALLKELVLETPDTGSAGSMLTKNVPIGILLVTRGSILEEGAPMGIVVGAPVGFELVTSALL